MLFNSYSFLFLFLPICLIGYWGLRHQGWARPAIAWLVICSLAFYAWWNPSYLALLMGSVSFNYVCSVGLARFSSAKARKATLLTAIVANLSMLTYFKYAVFSIESLNAIIGTSYSIGSILLPIGISFFTFQQIAFLVDSYRDRSGTPNFLDFCLFVAFFPQLIAGPIVHHKQMMPQFSQIGSGRLRTSHLAVGMTIFAIGLFKKVMIADEMAMHATPIFDAAYAGNTPTFLESWIGALSYTMQLYFDFSGYSDMAIGLARMFGIKLPVNFDSPYKATSIVEFWRRWHITLSQFLRDYLYIPLGGNKGGNLMRYRNLMITMLLGGLWHGAGWTFLAWGGLHGAYLMINHAVRNSPIPATATRLLGAHAFKAVCWATTFLAVVFAWVLFRAPTWEAATNIVSSMIGLNGLSMTSSVSRLHAITWIPLLFAFVLLLPNTQQLMSRYRPAFGFSKLDDKHPAVIAWHWRPSLGNAILIGSLFVLSIMHLNRVSEFVYYQF
ncbi:MBOAT family O-acyltransferase [Planctomycetes bacterium K23_9]|uniref:Peptidoglycan O-acetyltransferase n=1 Tax=Stieleria marina TaxID=1930275 RepID=A0A517NNS7_9BACT|nr:Peptidoglycan O-acetyltransferase [Planctomycetes bacterium K23_9]